MSDDMSDDKVGIDVGIDVPLDSILNELKKKGTPQKYLDSLRKKFVANPDQELSKAINNLLEDEEFKSKFARRWK